MNMIELGKMAGLIYKSDYNGIAESGFFFILGNKKLILVGKEPSFNYFDKHDLWHEHLFIAASNASVNKSIDEGCAYLYGGSWGMSWQDIFHQFQLKVAINPNSNWLEYKEKKPQFNFAENKAEYLMTDYLIDALIVQKIEKEKGFEGVWELLTCGKQDKDNTNYFTALEKLAGITRVNYNEKVWELIKTEEKKHSK